MSLWSETGKKYSRFLDDTHRRWVLGPIRNVDLEMSSSRDKKRKWRPWGSCRRTHIRAVLYIGFMRRGRAKAI